MKRLTTFLFLILFAFALQGQKVLTYDGKVLRAYDANQPLNVDETCEFWLDGKDDQSFTLDGTSVDQWDDKSGNGNHVLNGNADATRPTYAINTGRVTFTAANSTFLQSAAFGATLNQPNTIFIVAKLTDVTENNTLFDARTNNYQKFIETGTFLITAGVVMDSGEDDTNDNIHVGLFNGVSSEYWINGISKVSGDAGGTNLDGITLGIQGNLLTNPGDYEIMEVIGYNADISDVSRDKITGYLSNKWGITATTDFKGYILRQD